MRSMVTKFNVLPIPTPTQEEFKLWLDNNSLTWYNLDADERGYVQALYTKQRKQDYETRMRKARPLLRKQEAFGRPQHQGKAPGKDHIQGNVHQRIVNELGRLRSRYPDLKLFYNVASPKRSGTAPIIVLNGPTVSIIDIRMWDIAKTYSINTKYKVMQNGTFFPGGSIPLPLMVKAWKDLLPKGTRVQGIVVLPYGEARFETTPNLRPPYVITDLQRMNKIVEKPALRCEPDEVNKIDLITAVELLGRLNP